MAARILGAAALFIFSAAAACGGEKCLACHESHYVEKASCSGCHRGSEETTRKELAHYKLIPGKYAAFLIEGGPAEKGENLIAQARCRRCHTLGGEGALRASSLDSSARRLTSEKILEAVEKPNDNMPDFMFSESGLTALINGIYRAAFSAEEAALTQTVNFTDGKKDKIFEVKCGGCHKALLDEGAEGSRPLGPNLSGVTENEGYRINGELWNGELLEKWLKNPRSVKKNAYMPPIELTEEEIKAAVRALTGSLPRESARR